MKYGVVGSHVNLTSRIQSYTTGGQILISDATRREVGHILKTGTRMDVKAKGIEHPVTLYDALGIGRPHKLYLSETDETARSTRRGSFSQIRNRGGEPPWWRKLQRKLDQAVSQVGRNTLGKTGSPIEQSQIEPRRRRRPRHCGSPLRKGGGDDSWEPRRFFRAIHIDLAGDRVQSCVAYFSRQRCERCRSLVDWL